MSEHLEIEFKNLLSEQNYYKLVTLLQIPTNHFFVQENHYFDTDELVLKKMNSALRIRIFTDSAEATLKLPHLNGLLEITDKLSLSEAKNLVANKKLIGLPNITKKLNTLQITLHNLHFLGTLQTKRGEKKIPQGLLVLDQSHYNGLIDYEIEFEVNQFEDGKKFFFEFLKTQKIPILKTRNKVARMFDSLQ